MFELEKCLAFITNNAAKKMGDAFNEKLITFGITRVQWIALYYLGQSETISQQELGRKMDIKHPTVARLINRMEKEGYVKRIACPEDKRIRNLKLTEKGITLRNRLLPECERISKIFVDGISEDEKNLYKDILDRMIRNTGKIQEC
ncbi:MAG: MarR family transcriptional regulator, organic hydroperoxide resistance regulator [Candidatus Petromonas sp.]|nr:MarR family transcriptional regulator, organic hydroperoxide resistance regulator [Candidatus Petromonas sp.]